VAGLACLVATRADQVDGARALYPTGPTSARGSGASPDRTKRVATVYLDKEALRQLQKLAFDEETTIQALLVEGVNNVFASRSLSRIA